MKGDALLDMEFFKLILANQILYYEPVVLWGQSSYYLAFHIFIYEDMFLTLTFKHIDVISPQTLHRFVFHLCNYSINSLVFHPLKTSWRLAKWYMLSFIEPIRKDVSASL